MAIWLHSVDCGVSSKELRVEQSSYCTVLSSGGNLIHFYRVNLTPLLKFNKNIKSQNCTEKKKLLQKGFFEIGSETWVQEVASP